MGAVMLSVGLAMSQRWDTASGRDSWYTTGKQFWADAPASNSGVLCGSAHVHGADIADSKRFLLQKLRAPQKATLWPPSAVDRQLRALDVGGGIGRVSRNLLLELCDTVDLVDGCEKFVRQAESALGTGKAPPRRGRMGEFFVADLQNFVPAPQSYDLIWFQWAGCHLTDADMVNLLDHCRQSLAANGLLVVKDNVFDPATLDHDARRYVIDGRLLVGEEDSSITRTRVHLADLLHRAGLEVVAADDADLGDVDIFPVHTLAARARIRDGA